MSARVVVFLPRLLLLVVLEVFYVPNAALDLEPPRLAEKFVVISDIFGRA